MTEEDNDLDDILFSDILACLQTSAQPTPQLLAYELTDVVLGSLVKAEVLELDWSELEGLEFDCE